MATTSTSRRRAPHSSKKAPAPAASRTPAFYRPETWSPEGSVGYYMRRTVHLVTDAVDHELAPEGLTSTEWIPLLKPYMGHASPIAGVAGMCTLDGGAITRTLARIRAKGPARPLH